MFAQKSARIPIQSFVLLAIAFLGAFMFVSNGRTGSRQTKPRIAATADARGRHANVPEQLPISGLRDVFWRVVSEVSDDRVTLIAAGVTFYLLLATFPALTALVSLYGLVADPTTISEHLRVLLGVLPPGAFELISEQLTALTAKPHGTLGFTFFVSFAMALWSTHGGTLALFDAMNVAYEETEKRGYIRLNIIALCFTLCAMVSAAAVIGLVAILPLLLNFLWLSSYQEELALLGRWPALLLLVTSAILAIYRFGPSREPARLRWMTWGALLTVLAWLAMSFAFSFYLSHFANYNATYGTLGALIGFLIWTWLSATILIIGAELNAELERQTEKDSTTGAPRPMGARGAYVADTVGEAAD
ncbi:YihY/virulence factor BrkB family protein [Rhizobium calliandrae]